MQTVRSHDGTLIAFARAGTGPALIVVDGALCARAFGPSTPLAARLTEHFTVYTYDRRGRGDSGDTPPYTVDREIDDLAALVAEAGGSAFVFGSSSGAALALEAVSQGVPITKLAMYEAPFIVDGSRAPVPDDFLQRLREAVQDNRRGRAVRMFLAQVGVPTFVAYVMRFTPLWSKLTRLAHTLPYDFEILEDSQKGHPLSNRRWRANTAPTLVIDGGKSPRWMRNASRSLAAVLPNAEYRTLAGQTHMIRPAVVAPALIEFFERTAPAPVLSNFSESHLGA